MTTFEALVGVQPQQREQSRATYHWFADSSVQALFLRATDLLVLTAAAAVAVLSRGVMPFKNGELLPEHRIIGDAPGREAALDTHEFEERKPEDKWDVYYSKETMDEIQAWGHLAPERVAQYEFATKGKTMVVPPNSFFCMGDSRDDSEDSRFWGFVPRELIIGRAMFVYWSCDRQASNGSMLGCITSPRLSRIGKLIR